MVNINIQQASIKTATVEIKTLSVSGKQVTMGVFRQLISSPLINVETGELRGTPWGRVNYFWGECIKRDHYHVVWQLNKELRRACVWRRRMPDGQVAERIGHDLDDAIEERHQLLHMLLLLKLGSGHSGRESRFTGRWYERLLKMRFGVHKVVTSLAILDRECMPHFCRGRGGLPSDGFNPETPETIRDSLIGTIYRASQLTEQRVLVCKKYDENYLTVIQLDQLFIAV